MAQSADDHDQASFRAGAFIPIVFFLGPVVTAIMPRLAPLLLLIVGFALIVAGLRRGLGWREFLAPNPAMIALAVVAAYAALSAIWAAEPDDALLKPAVMLGAMFAVFAAARSISSLEPKRLREASIALIAGALCAALFVTIEFVTQGALTRTAMNFIPEFLPGSLKKVKVVDGRVIHLNMSELNQSVAVLTFQLWPGLLALSTLQSSRRKLYSLLFFLALAVPIALSEHESSQIGLIASTLILPLAWVRPRAVIRALAVAWCLGFVFVVPLDHLAYKAELHRAEWLPQSAQARLIIWDYTAERFAKRPWLGIGADSTKGAKAANSKPPEWPEGFVYPRATGHHAHNLFLQTLYELGVVGAILAAIAGAAVILRMALLPEQAQPYAAAAFTVFAIIASLAWSMWQAWLICAVGLLVLYVLLPAARYKGPRNSLETHAEAGST
jgi:O-antigen ligase